MRYDIDLMGRKKRWSITLAPASGSLKRIVLSAPVMILFIAALAGCVAYYVVLPLLSAPAVNKARLQELRQQQAALQQQREGMLQEARVAFQVKAQSPGWARLINTIGDYVPTGIWLSRIALEEEQKIGPRSVPTAGSEPQSEPSHRFLVIEGMVDTREHPSPLEPVSEFMGKLQGDQGIQQVLTSLFMVTSRATEDDPRILSFKLKGLWSPERAQSDLEDLIQAWFKAQGSAEEHKS